MGIFSRLPLESGSPTASRSLNGGSVRESLGCAILEVVSFGSWISFDVSSSYMQKAGSEDEALISHPGSSGGSGSSESNSAISLEGKRRILIIPGSSSCSCSSCCSVCFRRSRIAISRAVAVNSFCTSSYVPCSKVANSFGESRFKVQKLSQNKEIEDLYLQYDLVAPSKDLSPHRRLECDAALAYSGWFPSENKTAAPRVERVSLSECLVAMTDAIVAGKPSANVAEVCGHSRMFGPQHCSKDVESQVLLRMMEK